MTSDVNESFDMSSGKGAHRLVEVQSDALARIPEVAANGSDEEFYDEWVTFTAAVDALRSLLEDAYVNCPPSLQRELTDTLKSVRKNPANMIALARRVAVLEPLESARTVRTVDVGGRIVKYILRVAKDGMPSFVISTGRTRTLPVLDDTITDPRYGAGLISAYTDLVLRAQADHGATHLIFIDKNFGPVGALGMISSVVASTGLPATIYRERKWSKKADLSGYRPRAGEKGIVVYDLVNTGSAIRNAALRLREQFGSLLVAGAVLYDITGENSSVQVAGQADVILYLVDRYQAAVPSPADPGTQLATHPSSVSEPPNGSGVRTAPEGTAMTRSAKVPSGAYTKENLPPLSGEAKALLDEIQSKIASARLRYSLDQTPVKSAKSARLKLEPLGKGMRLEPLTKGIRPTVLK